MITALILPEPTVLLAFVAACFALAVTPGPGLMFIVATGMAGGARSGVAAALGTAAGASFHVLLAAFGVAALIAAHPVAFTALRWLGAAYLLWLAWETWRARPATLEADRGIGSTRRAFLRGTITNVLNPKVTLFALAFLPQFVSPEAGAVWAQILVLGAIMVVAVGIVDCIVGLVSGRAGLRLARAARGAGWLNKLAATVYAALGARLAIN